MPLTIEGVLALMHDAGHYHLNDLVRDLVRDRRPEGRDFRRAHALLESLERRGLVRRLDAQRFAVA